MRRPGHGLRCVPPGPPLWATPRLLRALVTDRIGLMTEAVRVLADFPRQELIWASPRELLNVFQADAIGCHIITVTNDVLKKLSLVGKDLDEYSLETVKMFRDDAVAAGFSLEVEGDGVGGARKGSALEVTVFAKNAPRRNGTVPATAVGK